MGFANFLVDLAAVAGASRSVARKHIALRARKIDRYTRESTVAQSVFGRQRQATAPQGQQPQQHAEQTQREQGEDQGKVNTEQNREEEGLKKQQLDQQTQRSTSQDVVKDTVPEEQHHQQQQQYQPQQPPQPLLAQQAPITNAIPPQEQTQQPTTSPSSSPEPPLSTPTQTTTFTPAPWASGNTLPLLLNQQQQKPRPSNPADLLAKLATIQSKTAALPAQNPALKALFRTPKGAKIAEQLKSELSNELKTIKELHAKRSRNVEDVVRMMDLTEGVLGKLHSLKELKGLKGLEKGDEAKRTEEKRQNEVKADDGLEEEGGKGVTGSGKEVEMPSQTETTPSEQVHLGDSAQTATVQATGLQTHEAVSPSESETATPEIPGAERTAPLKDVSEKAGQTDAVLAEELPQKNETEQTPAMEEQTQRTSPPEAGPEATVSVPETLDTNEALAEEVVEQVAHKEVVLTNELPHKPEPEQTPAAENVETVGQTKVTAAEEAHLADYSDKATAEPTETEPVNVAPAEKGASATETPTAQDTSSLPPTISSGTPGYQLRESAVPASRISRIWNYGGLAAGMVAGAIGEGLSRAVGGGSGSGSWMLSEANMERLVSKLSRMRGAALKLGQMMSFQDAKMLPPQIQEVLQRVQDRADYMPAWQRDRVLNTNLGADWRDLFSEFEEKPIAAASIGQVHRAVLRSNGAPVAVKIQFPGVADSINSDLDNLAILLNATKLLPKGLYLDKTIANARTELAWECDYEREADCAERYRRLLMPSSCSPADAELENNLPTEDDPAFSVPVVYREASGKHVLTMEFMRGTAVTRLVPTLTQSQRDWIGTQILRLCLREIAEFRFMQTDPNWTNFLYNPSTNRLELLDFGASRAYPDEFVSKYLALLAAAARADRNAVRDLSTDLGYLTGHESKAMLDAHVTSVVTLAEPFLKDAPEVYDFRGQTITERVKAQIPVMIRERLAPPPEETYSLHRKLSGAFLLCARLGSRVKCRELFEEALEKAGIMTA
ncbi:hypothetical protein VTJ04DRAFT_7865 [Mycothermus thermophilus]|uniref:uncharacterized protein n=1 Tax=Humicola insolens TaxID=85995 RepID=UPI003742F955